MTPEYVPDRNDEPGDAEQRRDATTRRENRRREREEQDEEAERCGDKPLGRYCDDLEAETAILRRQLVQAEKKA